MAHMSQFDSPLLLGFDQIERLLDRVGRSSSDGYPPYNIEKVNEQVLRITLAVAGFDADTLSITVEDNQLVIRGKQADDSGREYLHRGIAARQFQRIFVLADGIEISSAELDNGLLNVNLTRRKPETVIRKIEIVQGSSGKRRK